MRCLVWGVELIRNYVIIVVDVGKYGKVNCVFVVGIESGCDLCYY